MLMDYEDLDLDHPVKHEKRIVGIPTSKKEIFDLLKAWLAITIAFTILLNGLQFNQNTILIIIIAAVTVGSGFLLHELMHKLVAQKYRCWAEFRADDTMLLVAIGFSFFGFIFAAPGAVMISGNVDYRKNGIISLAGPLTNYVLSLLFLPLIFVQSPLIHSLGLYGFMINSWLGLFNMIPFGNFDGVKVLHWSKLYYGLMVGFGVLLLIVKIGLPYLF